MEEDAAARARPEDRAREDVRAAGPADLAPRGGSGPKRRDATGHKTQSQNYS